MKKNYEFSKIILSFFIGILIFYLYIYLSHIWLIKKINSYLFIIILLIPIYMLFFWILISILFNNIFKNKILSELKINALIVSSLFFLIPFFFIYIKFYDRLSSITTLILGNIYIPFHGYIKINMAEYFLISFIGLLWLFIIYLFSIRFIKNFYNKFELINPTLRKKIIFIFSFIFYLVTTSYVTLIYPPTGDEPHYITTAISIAKDLDFNLKNNYEEKRYYFKFYPDYIQDYKNIHTIEKNNGYYPTHNIGLSVLISPLITANGRYWLQFFMNLVTAFLIIMIYILLLQIGIDDRKAALLSLSFGICMPIITHASLILTEIPAALLISYAIYFLFTDKNTYSKRIIFFFSIGFLPWLHSKFIIFSFILYIIYYYLIVKNNHFNFKNELINNIPVFLLFLLNFYYYSIYNLIYPFQINRLHEKVYTSDLNLHVNKFEINPVHFFIAFLAIFFDRDFGLITYCVLYIISFWGMILAFLKKAKKFLIPVIICIPYLIIFLFWKDWTGSMTPARQLVPVIPLFIIFAAYFIESFNILNSKLFRVLWILSIFLSWLSTSFPILRYSSSKDKIYLLISKIIPEWILLIIPSFRKNIPAAIIISFFFILIIFYLFNKILKYQDKKIKI
ncbi:MAG: hypothetical protein N3E50_07355 [Candidatus Goldbacteria bacterium]|nr:hypothetical protein [Candidatus Goldiibacteriota bacterium]